MPEPWAAAYVGLSVSTFRRHVADTVVAIKLSPHRRGYLREDLDAWVDRKAGRESASGADEWSGVAL